MRRRWAETAFVAACWLAAIVLIGSVLTILGYLVVKGAGSLTPELLFGDTDPWLALTGRRQVFDGILPAVVGTIVLVVLSVGLALIILLHKQFAGAVQPSLLISALALACLVLPYIIRSTELAIDGIDLESRLAAQALGASKLQNTIHVLIPRALSGILSGSILAVGRCAEDTAVIMLTGVVASVGFPGSLLERYEAVPFFIYYISAQYTDQQELMQGYGAAIVLLAVCTGLFLLANTIKRGFAQRAFVRV